MHGVEIDGNNCGCCGACTKPPQMLYLGGDNLVGMRQAAVEGNMAESMARSIYEMEASAGICPGDCFIVYDENCDEVEIERNDLGVVSNVGFIS